MELITDSIYQVQLYLHLLSVLEQASESNELLLFFFDVLNI